MVQGCQDCRRIEDAGRLAYFAIPYRTGREILHCFVVWGFDGAWQGGKAEEENEELLKAVFEAAEELLVTADMAERKNIMIERAEAFICLPGAFGTLDEMLEIITLKQLDYHDKPIVLVNTDGFYDTLLGFFRRLEKERLIYKECLELYEAVSDVESALDLLEAEPGSTPGDDPGGR